MANEDHVAILKQGVEVWNKWREENPDVRPNLCEVDLAMTDLTVVNLNEANLSGADLIETLISRVNLDGVDLMGADLSKADLRWANLNGAYLFKGDLSDADLREANLSEATLAWANLSEANLMGADLHRADLRWANLMGADLHRADLSAADLAKVDLTVANLSAADLSLARLTLAQLIGTDLSGANLTEARIARTTFGIVDLRMVKGLDTIIHESSSTIGIDTIYRSKGQIPETFLRGCGVPDTFIEFARSLALSARPIDYYSCFISYSSNDEGFAQRLHADLQDNGVRCWFAPEDMKIGDKIRQRIDESIRIHDKLLLVLSDNSIDSQWVEKEVETAWEEERRRGEMVLFPVRLDDSVFETDQAWAADVRRQRHIGDFREWKEHDSYQEAFERLLRDLKAED